MIRWWLCGCLIFALGSLAEAQEISQNKKSTNTKPSQAKSSQAKPVKKRRTTQSAVVQVEGAAIYDKADFDSQILESLPAGKKVVITKKLTPGKAGLGAFYRIRSSNGKIGYITDVDVIPEYRRDEDRPRKIEKNPVFEDVKRQQENRHKESLFLTRYLGAGIGLVDYTETFSGRALHSDTTLFNFRMTGPGVLFDGPPLDFNFAVSFSPPDYYDEFTSSPTTGFFLFGNLNMLMPLLDWYDSGIFFGFGAMWTYTRFDVKVRTTPIDSQELRVGADFNLGYAIRFDRIALRADANYYWEKNRYLGYWLSVMMQY